ncbi:MAG: YdeI/OmpD-associated family protein [Patescibacteria group bacterium]|jgi:uncharacterized protein YdeI (YjbR/CyaY-like superfamily)
MKIIISKSVKKASETKVPADLRKALAATPKVGRLWENLTPIARRDFISWIVSAKQPETRQRRIERVPDMLMSGKRRPCCYALVPMDLYRVVGASAKAKAKWHELTSNQRRDFIDWVESAKESETHKKRIQKICSTLAAGKTLKI